ncbi:Coi1 protein [Scheffersomyces amazonensis]|uniref:Coi1 protein n=1 Tax=Scheffersomyces amazonensis TaxID=1078765 RepID=UPI00315D7C9F
MVSVNFISAVALSLLSLSSKVNAFDLLRDEQGYAILPPTELVIKHLADLEAEEDPSEYTVVTTIHKNGEVVKVNLNTHEIQQTGLYKRNYDTSAYYTEEASGVFKRDIQNTSGFCFNEDADFGISQCTFDFVAYDSPSNCTALGAQYYSCVLDLEKIQDSTQRLKNMVPNPAQTRCFKSLDKAIAANAANGACGK